MDAGMIGIVFAIVVNILVTAFCAGKLYQKVGDLAGRIGQLERKLENTDGHIDNLSERVAKLEGKLE